MGGLDTEQQEKGGINYDSQIFSLSNLERGSAIADVLKTEFGLRVWPRVHVNFKIPFKYPNADVKQSVKYVVLKLRRESWARDT